MSSKHVTPKVSPRDELLVQASVEEDESVEDLDTEAEKLLDAAMEEQGYDVITKERAKKEQDKSSTPVGSL